MEEKVKRADSKAKNDFADEKAILQLKMAQIRTQLFNSKQQNDLYELKLQNMEKKLINQKLELRVEYE